MKGGLYSLNRNVVRKISTFLCLSIAGYVVEKEIERLQQKHKVHKVL